MFTYDTLTKILKVPWLEEVKESFWFGKKNKMEIIVSKIGYMLLMNAQTNGLN